MLSLLEIHLVYFPPKTKKIQDSARSGFPSVTGFRAHLCCTLALAPAETHVNLVGRATCIKLSLSFSQLYSDTAEFAATRPVSDRHRVLFHRVRPIQQVSVLRTMMVS